MSFSLISFNGKVPKLGKKVYLADGVRLIGDIEIGDDSSVFFNAVLRADISSIRIGSRTNIQDNVTIHLSHIKGVEIGNDVTIGHNAILHACTIEDHCLIGMGAIVMDGAIIRKNSVVAAGALVTPDKEYPEGSLIIGAPARIGRSLTVEEMEMNARDAANYVIVKDELLQGSE
jgi:carbonic anhydrase/acetyltransferase-like protein (isoleucine patch superfamily)